MSAVRPPRGQCLKLPDWPPGDRAAWLAAPSKCRNPAQRWAAGTRRMVLGGYGRWLTWLAEQGLLDPACPPAARVTPGRVVDYIAALRGEVGGFSVAARVEQLGNALRALAPEGHWHGLQRQASIIRAEAKAARAAPKPPAPPAFNRCVPVGEWPADDRQAWEAAQQSGDLLEPGGMAADWRPATWTMAANGYGRWLTWLAAQHAELLALPAAERATRERLAAYAADLRAVNGAVTVATRVREIGNALRVLAPQRDWRWVQRAADRLRAQAEPVRDKRPRLQSPERLVALGQALMAQADDAATGWPAERAALHRDGLLIALLAHRPLRARNLVAIRIGQHLVRRGDGWWLVFTPEETKTRVVLEVPWPAELAPALHRHLADHRPVLLARGARPDAAREALWVSKQGRQMSGAAIRHQVGARTAAAFGRPLSPHLFRDCAATAVAIAAPQRIGIVPRLLGHTTLTTSERHYNLAGSLEAGRRYADTIATLRSPQPISRR